MKKTLARSRLTGRVLIGLFLGLLLTLAFGSTNVLAASGDVTGLGGSVSSSTVRVGQRVTFTRSFEGTVCGNLGSLGNFYGTDAVLVADFDTTGFDFVSATGGTLTATGQLTFNLGKIGPATRVSYVLQTKIAGAFPASPGAKLIYNSCGQGSTTVTFNASPKLIAVSVGPLPNTGPALTSQLFPTGFRMDGTILSYWLSNGGLTVFGYPLDSAREDNGQVSQWLERNRFELHEENAAPYNVLLGRLGVEALQAKGIDWTTLPKVSSAPANCLYFAETSHSLCGQFLAYWKSHGLEFDNVTGKSYAESLALFGFPISEPRMETNSSGDAVLTQWFERARLEYHPNNPADFQVLMGRLGAEVMPK